MTAPQSASATVTVSQFLVDFVAISMEYSNFKEKTVDDGSIENHPCQPPLQPISNVTIEARGSIAPSEFIRRKVVCKGDVFPLLFLSI